MFKSAARHCLVAVTMLVAAAPAYAQDLPVTGRDQFGKRETTRNTDGVEGVSTGNKNLDILLNARMSSSAAASSTAAGGSSAMTLAASAPPAADKADPLEAGRSDGSPDTLRRALIHDAGSQMLSDTQSPGAEQKRRVEHDVQFANQVESRSGKPDANHQGGLDGLEANSLILPREFLAALREYRYLVLGLASACALATWRLTSRAARYRNETVKDSQRPDKGRSGPSGRRRRHRH